MVLNFSALQFSSTVVDLCFDLFLINNGWMKNKTEFLEQDRANWNGMLSSKECFRWCKHRTPENARWGKKWNKLTPIDWGRKHEGREKICKKSWYIVCLISNFFFDARLKLIQFRSWKWEIVRRFKTCVCFIALPLFAG